MSTGDFVPPTPEELDALLPDCTIQALIAQGGMGAIYRGLQTKLDRLVAIKVLPKNFGTDLEFASRFEQEARAMAKLGHNNIVGVYDYGESSDGAFLYFIMEFVQGSDLFHMLQEGAVNYSRALPLLIQICDALQYAHENGIVHRDIKPANILIDETGTVKMADFGLAKVQRGGADLDGAESDTAFGTPDYVAPETLIEGVEVDHRADIYSLGVVIYEVLTGKIPEGTFALPSTVNSEIDRRLDDLVVKAMSYDRDLRFSNVDEIKSVLVAIEKTPRLVAGGGGPAPVVVAARGAAPAFAGAATRRVQLPRREKTSNAGAILTVLFLLLAGGAAFYWFVLKPGSGPQEEPVVKVVPGSNTSIVPDAPATDPPRMEADPQAAPGPPAKPEEPEEPEIIEPIPKKITPIPYAGSLRGIGTWPEQKDILLTNAEGIDDIAVIRARDGNWHALRVNGEALSSGPAEHGMTGLRWMDARKRIFRAVKTDGTLWINKTRQLFPGKITNALQAGSGGSHHEALLADGTLAVWGAWYGTNMEKLGEPPSEFTDLVDLASSPGAVALLDSKGVVSLYNNDLEIRTRLPRTDGDRVVDIEAAGGDFVALTKSGRAVSWFQVRHEDNHYLPAHIESEFFIKVRGGNAVKAAQKADGTWIAWGNRKWGIIDKIESLPPTPDIAMSVYDTYGHLYWIEPNPAFMPAEDGTIPAPGGSAPSTTEVDPSTLSGAARLVAELRLKVRKRHTEMVQKPYLESLSRLNEQYLLALERSAPADQAIASDLEAARKAIAAAASSNSPPPVLVPDTRQAPAPTGPLLNMRDTYRREHSKLVESRDTNGRAVLNTYVSDLEILETDVKASSKPGEASVVRSAIDAARSSGLDLFAN